MTLQKYVNALFLLLASVGFSTGAAFMLQCGIDYYLSDTQYGRWGDWRDGAGTYVWLALTGVLLFPSFIVVLVMVDSLYGRVAAPEGERGWVVQGLRLRAKRLRLSANIVLMLIVASVAAGLVLFFFAGELARKEQDPIGTSMQEILSSGRESVRSF